MRAGAPRSARRRPTTGTIDKPSGYEPYPTRPAKQKQKQNQPMSRHMKNGAKDPHQNRTRNMQLMPESLARAQLPDCAPDTESEPEEPRPLSARGLQRRAGRATLRARRALAMAVMQ